MHQHQAAWAVTHHVRKGDHKCFWQNCWSHTSRALNLEPDSPGRAWQECWLHTCRALHHQSTCTCAVGHQRLHVGLQRVDGRARAAGRAESQGEFVHSELASTHTLSLWAAKHFSSCKSTDPGQTSAVTSSGEEAESHSTRAALQLLGTGLLDGCAPGHQC